MQEILEKLQGFADRLPTQLRLAIAKRASSSFTAQALETMDEEIAVEILRLLAVDVEVQVRKLLAHSLKNDPRFPHDIALQLAHDVAEVADPLLQHCTVLSDEELGDILRQTKEESSHLAVARRTELSAPLTQILTEVGSQNVVFEVAQNKGAAVNDNALLNVAERFPRCGASDFAHDAAA
jgi:uncharacterized protein (DUF2336 family)